MRNKNEKKNQLKEVCLSDNFKDYEKGHSYLLIPQSFKNVLLYLNPYSFSYFGLAHMVMAGKEEAFPMNSIDNLVPCGYFKGKKIS